MKRILGWGLLLITVWLLLIARTVGAQEVLDTETIDTYIQAEMEAFGVPGVSLAVVRDGELIYSQGYGVRDLTTGEAVTPDTQFFIGSITKSFTALAIAQQVDAGNIDLDVPITTYLPDFQLSDPAMTPKLTLRALLSNAAGFTPDDVAVFTGNVRTLEDVAAHVQTLPVTSEPGTTYAYNNLGFALAGYVLEQVTGESWADYVRQHIFVPLHMDQATTSFDAMQQLSNYVAPHMPDVYEGVKRIPYFDNMDPIAPAGAINASALEMANYARFQLGDGTFEGERIVSEEMLDEMHTTQVDTYALGWVTDQHAGYDTVWHDGSIDGFGALVGLVPSESLGVVALMNADYLDDYGFLNAIVLRTVEIALDVQAEQDVMEVVGALDPAERAERFEAARNFEPDATAYADFAGKYQSLFGDIHVELREDRPYLVIVTQGFTQAYELVEFETGSFIANGHGTFNSVFSFQHDDDGTIRMMQDEVLIGFQEGENTQNAYADPQQRFSVSFPTTLTVETRDDFAVATSSDPHGTFSVGALDSSSDLLEDARTFAEHVGSAVEGDPIATNPLPMPDGQQWTQYVWVLPNGDLFAVNSYASDETAYFLTAQGKQADIQALLTPMSEILLSFTITE